MGSKRRLVGLGLLAVTVAVVAISYVRGSLVTDAPYSPTTPEEGVRCEIIKWAGDSHEKGVRCAAVFERPLAQIWAQLVDYEGLAEAYDNIWYDYIVDRLEGTAPGPVILKGEVKFWLMRFPFDMVLRHTAGKDTERFVTWDSNLDRFATQGSWRLETLSPTRTRIEYRMAARVALLPDFAVRSLLRANLDTVIESLAEGPVEH